MAPVLQVQVPNSRLRMDEADALHGAHERSVHVAQAQTARDNSKPRLLRPDKPIGPFSPTHILAVSEEQAGWALPFDWTSALAVTRFERRHNDACVILEMFILENTSYFFQREVVLLDVDVTMNESMCLGSCY